MVEENFQGKYFSITDKENVNTVIYQINRNDRELAKNGPKFVLERLEYSEEYIGDKKKKTFFVNELSPEGNPILILSCSKEKVVVNSGFLDYDVINISKKTLPIRFSTLQSSEEEYKEFAYTPNMRRPISILDPETGEEVRPTLYFDEETNEVKGKCKLKPNKKYFAFELREKK